MGKKRSVDTRFWNDTYISELKSDHKLLFLYLITSPLSNMLGVYEISEKRISFDTSLPFETIREGLETFKKDKKADYISGYVVLVNFVTNQNYNKNMLISAVNEIEEVPLMIQKTPFFGMVIKRLRRVSNGSVMVPNIEVESEVESELEYEVESEGELENSHTPGQSSFSPPVIMSKKESIEPEADIPERKEWDEYLLASLRYTKEFTDHLWDHLKVKGWKKGEDIILDWRAYARNQKSWNYEYNQKIKNQTHNETETGRTRKNKDKNGSILDEINL